jgi:hypothetical protein
MKVSAKSQQNSKIFPAVHQRPKRFWFMKKPNTKDLGVYSKKYGLYTG